MTTKNDGGPAFPVEKDSALSPVTDFGGNDISSGMTLRDWLSGQALCGFLSGIYAGEKQGTEFDDGFIAARCYGISDAMIAERAK